MRVTAEGAPQPALRVFLLAKSWQVVGEPRRTTQILGIDVQTQFEREIPMLILHCSLVVFFLLAIVFKQEFHFDWGIGSLQCWSQGGTGDARDFCFESWTKSSIVDHLENKINCRNVPLMFWFTFWWGANLSTCQLIYCSRRWYGAWLRYLIMQLHQLLRHGTPTAMSVKTYGYISIDRKSPIFFWADCILRCHEQYSKTWKCRPHMSQNMFHRAQEKHDPEYGKELVLHYLPPPPDSDGNRCFLSVKPSLSWASKVLVEPLHHQISHLPSQAATKCLLCVGA